MENLNDDYIVNYIKIDMSNSRKRKRDSEEKIDKIVESSDLVMEYKFVNDLCIKLKELKCLMFVKNWYNVLGVGDLFLVFGNVFLKYLYVF